MERDEAPLVFPLLLHNFFLGAGIAFLFTTSSAIFIHEFEGAMLALAFVVAGVAMMLVARVYAHFEHKLALEKYLPAVVLALPVIVLMVRLSGYMLNHAVVAFAMLIAYRIVYMLANLEFWGLTSLVFDIRQSKRLFGLIGSGDIPAKMLGYLAVSLLSKAVAPEDLLYASVVAFLLGFLMLRRVLRNPAAIAQLHHHTHHSHHHKQAPPPDRFLRKFFGSEFIFALAAFALLSSFAMGLVDFSFYGKVKHQYHTSHELASFLGLFMTSAMVVTFSLKLLFTGKLLQRIGVSKILLFLPILLLLPCLVLLLPIEMTGDQKVMLWFFSMMYLVRDVSKYTLVDPMFLALFQPLNSHSRLRGHTIMKGLVDPFGLVCIGAAIFAGETYAEESMFKILAVALALVCLLWTYTAHRLSQEWLDMLRDSVRKRFLDGQSVSIAGKPMTALLLTKLESGQETEAIYALRMLEDNPLVDFNQLLIQALGRPLPALQQFVLECLAKREATIPEELLLRLAADGGNRPLQRLASKLLLSTIKDASKIDSFTRHSDDAVRGGAIAGLLLNSDSQIRNRGEDVLQQLIGTARQEDSKLALWIIGETRQDARHGDVGSLLGSDSNIIVQDAIQTAGKLGHPALLPALIALAKKPAHRAAAILALANFDADDISKLAEGNHTVLRALCKIGGQPGSAVSTEFLLTQMHSQDVHLRREAIHALMKRGFKAPKDKKVADLIAELQRHLQTGLKQYGLLLASEKGMQLANAIQVELRSLADLLLMSFTFIHDTRTVLRVRHGLQFENRELRADALEILDHLLPRAQAARVLPLLEVIFLGRSDNTDGKTSTETMLQSCIQVMEKASSVHDAWTLSLATDHYLQYGGAPSKELVQNAMAASTPFLAKYSHWLSRQFPSILNSDHMNATTGEGNGFSPLEIVLMLKASALFSETPENTLAEVAAIVIVEQVPEGDVLFQKGDTGDCMYLIAEGEIRIGDGATIFATLGKNDFFGELALVETEPRSADAVAATDCLLLRIDQDDFYELIEDRTEVARGILVILAQRLRRQNEIIRQLRQENR
ncbi:MAG: cyclic nucleotide-binding domain-containing protein [Bacteroidetes bacterium]|nr:cyclic nucleotide-binding domain-containing protein [Bacteroidota bacterium]